MQVVLILFLRSLVKERNYSSKNGLDQFPWNLVSFESVQDYCSEAADFRLEFSWY